MNDKAIHMTGNRIKNVLFDLDGTLVDSSDTVAASLHHALDELGTARHDRVPTESLIGKPLLDIFCEDYSLDHDQAIRAIGLYRDYYDALDHRGTRIYEGVEVLLRELTADGYDLYIATVKPTPIADKVLKGMGLREYFSGVAGASMGPERRDKAGVIAYALETFELNPEVSVMVGDRDQDLNGARSNGLQAVGVLYGFGSREELESAGALGLARHAADIPALLA